MIVLGIKLTHDAAVAAIDLGRPGPSAGLLFCHEREKVSNGPRYARIDSPSDVHKSLVMEGLDWRDVSAVVIDGWKHRRIPHHDLPCAGYHEFDDGDLAPEFLGERVIRGELPASFGARLPYLSTHHMASHVLGSYLASPFAERMEETFVLSWDGGQTPRIHRIASAPGRIVPRARFVAALSSFYGIIYGIMGYYFGPYRRDDVRFRAYPPDATSEAALYGGYETPGKLMGYLALGRQRDDLLRAAETVYAASSAISVPRFSHAFHQDGVTEHSFMRDFSTTVSRDFPDATDADALLAVHRMLERQLVHGAIANTPRGARLIFTGGSALNIKWNSALRASGHFSEVWVPPFPNDSGCALGAAALVAAESFGKPHLEWGVYSGPRLVHEAAPSGWTRRECDVDELAQLLASNPTAPIVVLSGRAELGPRALGHRSILCSATDASTKHLLNRIKLREDFRPVAPICLEHRAPTIFDPGTPDPFMLFDHAVRPEWRERIPAIVHLDGTARLQTISARDDSTVHRLLSAYERITGIPVLCNTSANHLGRGFFHSAAEAMRWGGTDCVWENGVLWRRG